MEPIGYLKKKIGRKADFIYNSYANFLIY